MSSFQGLSSVTGLNSFANQGAVVADVTPNSVDWDDYTFNEFSGGSILGTSSGAKTISGISTSINIYYSCIYCGDSVPVYYKKNGGAWTAVSENENISVSNNDTIDWGSGQFGYVSFSVKNASDGNATIDGEVSLEVGIA